MIPSPRNPNYEFAIIGAGFAGLGMGIKLKQADRHNFIIFERADELGGTWRDNTYPGCACDIPSVVYSFSFDQNPNWSRLYPSQREILAYLKACVERFNIRRHIQFKADVSCLRWDEAGGYWYVQTRDGGTVTARHVVSAMGPLNRPNIPTFPGLDQFQGATFHSSQWNHDIDLRGKRVAVIGTGASAIQFVPQIAPSVDQLHIFQRTPPWVVPRGDKQVSSLRKQLFRRFPQLQNALRGGRYWLLESQVFSFLGNERANQIGTQVAIKHIEDSISDPTLRKAVTPDYKLGCKRILVSDDYYPALARSNVELITSGVKQITSSSITDNEGVEREVDVIIFGTGFVASEFLVDMEIFGRFDNLRTDRHQRELLTEWRKTGPEAYFGINVSGYPNLHFLLGPNTGLGHNSVLLMIESQYNYIFDYLRLLDEKDAPFLDLKPEAQTAHNTQIQQKLQKTVWQSGGCQSWYQMDNGKNTTLWPGSTVAYRKATRHVDATVFQDPNN